MCMQDLIHCKLQHSVYQCMTSSLRFVISLLRFVPTMLCISTSYKLTGGIHQYTSIVSHWPLVRKNFPVYTKPSLNITLLTFKLLACPKEGCFPSPQPVIHMPDITSPAYLHHDVSPTTVSKLTHFQFDTCADLLG